MLELGQEATLTIDSLIKSLKAPRPLGENREVIPGEWGPIVVIRGFGGLSGPHEDRLKEEMAKANLGGVIVAIAPGPGNEELASFIPKLVEEVNKFDRRVVLLGYSMGGLIALLGYGRELKDKVRGIITVGTPLNGIGGLSLLKLKGGMLNDVTPGSKKLNEIKSIKLPDDTYHLFAKFDEFAGDPKKINISGKKIVLPIWGHNRFLQDPLTASTITNTVQNIIHKQYS